MSRNALRLTLWLPQQQSCLRAVEQKPNATAQPRMRQQMSACPAQQSRHATRARTSSSALRAYVAGVRTPR
eukprot:3077204-Pleurochrysis_carterae.AAC.3